MWIARPWTPSAASFSISDREGWACTAQPNSRAVPSSNRVMDNSPSNSVTSGPRSRRATARSRPGHRCDRWSRPNVRQCRRAPLPKPGGSRGYLISAPDACQEAAIRGLLARTNALKNFPSISPAIASTSNPASARASFASAARYSRVDSRLMSTNPACSSLAS